MMKNIQKGFTLIELMIVVAISVFWLPWRSPPTATTPPVLKPQKPLR